MSAATVNQALIGFRLSDEERSEMQKIVAKVFDDRAKSLHSDFESWETVEEESPLQNRAIASTEPVTSKQMSPKKGKHGLKADPTEIRVLDPKEVEFSMGLLQQHLYGDEEDQKMLKENDRKPASATKLKDSEYERKKKKLKKQTGEVAKEISDLHLEPSE